MMKNGNHQYIIKLILSDRPDQKEYYTGLLEFGNICIAQTTADIDSPNVRTFDSLWDAVAEFQRISHSAQNIQEDNATFIKKDKEQTRNDDVKNFNTDDEWYPLVLTDSLSEGMSTIWIKDDAIPCRKSHVRYIEIIKEQPA